MFTDLTIDMTNDNEWQPPMDSAYDNETGMTYWVTSLYNSENFQFNWYVKKKILSFLSFQNFGGKKLN